MKKIKLGFILVLAVALAVVVLQNTAPVQVSVLWLTGEVPAVLLLFLTAGGGFILGLLVALLMKGGAESGTKS